jgi:hypothetical protein
LKYTLYICSFRGNDCDTDHYLVTAQVRETLLVRKQAAQKLDVERFNLKKLSKLQVRKQYKIKIMGWDSVVSIVTCYRLDNPGIESSGGEIFCTCPDQAWGPSSLLYNGYRVFTRGKVDGAWH